ncbi:MAG: (2Fe-2S)-binding protein [Deltaproteobacteria bacterium]|nr:(2Fe-2S)-binding protein [Deltaproteobacteria bacterium]
MDNKIKIKVDNNVIEAAEGANLLQTCLDNDIYIPNLCYMKDMKTPPVSCRLCFVELEGVNNPVSSCTVKIKEGMVVRTDTGRVRRLQQEALKLLLSTHLVDCKNCPANKKCEIQKLARFLKVGLKDTTFEKKLKQSNIDETHSLIHYYPNRCVLCGRCVYVCEEKGHSILSFAKRGLDTVISLYGQEENLACETCRACIDVCPVMALRLNVSKKE